MREPNDEDVDQLGETIVEFIESKTMGEDGIRWSPEEIHHIICGLHVDSTIAMMESNAPEKDQRLTLKICMDLFQKIMNSAVQDLLHRQRTTQ